MGKSENEFEQFEHIYRELYNAESDGTEDITDCKMPCNYNEFKFLYSSPDIMNSPPFASLHGFSVASRKTQIEEEVLLYPFTSFVAEVPLDFSLAFHS